MANKANSLAHTKWMCNHIVFTTKYRRKIVYNQYKESLSLLMCSKSDNDVVA